jgi:hypothetical protein
VREAAAVLDVRGKLGDPTRQPDLVVALGGDWQAVGNDLRFAIVEFKTRPKR